MSLNRYFDGPPEQRFERHYIPEPNTGCWLWLGSINPDTGYAQFNAGNKRIITGHRFSYEMAKGKIPDDLVIDHLCRVRCCVNPDHLEAVTNGENIRRGVGVGKHLSSTLVCPKGHRYTPENTKLDKDGWRHCRTCNIEAQRRWRERKRHVSDNS